jgi:hypothetical protein
VHPHHERALEMHRREHDYASTSQAVRHVFDQVAELYDIPIPPEAKAK